MFPFILGPYLLRSGDMQVQPSNGFDVARFTALLNSEEGCPATDEHLLEALIHHLKDREDSR